MGSVGEIVMQGCTLLALTVLLQGCSCVDLFQRETYHKDAKTCPSNGGRTRFVDKNGRPVSVLYAKRCPHGGCGYWEDPTSVEKSYRCDEEALPKGPKEHVLGYKTFEYQGEQTLMCNYADSKFYTSSTFSTRVDASKALQGECVRGKDRIVTLSLCDSAFCDDYKHLQKSDHYGPDPECDGKPMSRCDTCCVDLTKKGGHTNDTRLFEMRAPSKLRQGRALTLTTLTLTSMASLVAFSLVLAVVWRTRIATGRSIAVTSLPADELLNDASTVDLE